MSFTELIDIKKLFEKNLGKSKRNIKIKKIVNLIHSNIEQTYIKNELIIKKEKTKQTKQTKQKIKKEVNKEKTEKDNNQNIEPCSKTFINQEKINEEEIYQEKYNDFRIQIKDNFNIQKVSKNSMYRGFDISKINLSDLDYFTNIIQNFVSKSIKNKFKYQINSNTTLNINFELTQFLNLKYIPYDDMFLASYKYELNNKIGYLSIELYIENNNSNENTKDILEGTKYKDIFDDFKFNFNIKNNMFTSTNYKPEEKHFFDIQKEYYQHLVDIE